MNGRLRFILTFQRGVRKSKAVAQGPKGASVSGRDGAADDDADDDAAGDEDDDAETAAAPRRRRPVSSSGGSARAVPALLLAEGARGRE